MPFDAFCISLMCCLMWFVFLAGLLLTKLHESDQTGVWLYFSGKAHQPIMGIGIEFSRRLCPGTASGSH